MRQAGASDPTIGQPSSSAAAALTQDKDRPHQDTAAAAEGLSSSAKPASPPPAPPPPQVGWGKLRVINQPGTITNSTPNIQSGVVDQVLIPTTTNNGGQHHEVVGGHASNSVVTPTLGFDVQYSLTTPNDDNSRDEVMIIDTAGKPQA